MLRSACLTLCLCPSHCLSHCLSLCLSLCLCLLASAAGAEGRMALVIAASDYDTLSDLANPDNDAGAVKDLLRDLGFKVTVESDRDAETTRDALERFAEKAAGADIALVYYAGHGTEVQGENRLLPTDADASSLKALAETSLPLSDIAATLTRLAPAAVLLVDACRDSPFAGTPLEADARNAVALPDATPRVISPGFARVGPAEGLIYAFATAPGDTASDGPEDGHSPFAEAILRHLGKPGLELSTVLTLVQRDVRDRTRGAQTPYVEDGLPDLVFAAGQPQDLSERDALLLAMASLSPEAQAQVEALAAARNMPFAPLYAALLTLDPTRTSLEDQTRALQEAADAYADLQDKLGLLSPADPRVADLRTAAAADLDLGQTQAAQEKFQEAIALDDAGREAGKDLYLSRTLSQADTLLLSADAARVDFEYDTAIAALTQGTALYAEIAHLGLSSDEQAKRVTALGTLGDLQLLVGNTTGSLAAYREWNAISRSLSEAFPTDAKHLRDLSVSLSRIGDILVAQGKLEDALAAYREDLAITKALVARDPDNTELQHDLSVSQERIGEILVSQGNLDGALPAYRAALAIRESLVAADAENVIWLRDLSVSREKIGDIQKAKGDLTAALSAYQEALAVRETLLAADPDNPQRQRDISVSHHKIGEIFYEQGDLDGALAAFGAMRDIAETLAARDPANTGWQRDLSISHNKFGEALLAKGDPDGALVSYQAALAIRETLSARDPANSEWQRDLSVSHDRIGDTLRAQEKFDEALVPYRASLAIRETLAAQDPSNSLWQRDLGVSYNRIGSVLFSLGDLEGALAAYQADLAISQALAARDPGNSEWQRDLAVSLNRHADILAAQGNVDAALADYKTSLAITLALAALQGSSVEAAIDLVVSHFKVSTVSADPRPNLEAALAILLQLQSEGRLPAANEPWVDAVSDIIAALPPASP